MVGPQGAAGGGVRRAGPQGANVRTTTYYAEPVAIPGHPIKDPETLNMAWDEMDKRGRPFRYRSMDHDNKMKADKDDVLIYEAQWDYASLVDPGGS